MPYEESRERFTEILDIVKRAWTEPRFSYAGKYHSFDNVACAPKPYQKPLPEIRIAASTPDTFPAIGALGYPIFASTRHPTWSDLAPHIKAYYDAYRAAGHPGKGQVFVSAPIYIAETEEQARAVFINNRPEFLRQMQQGDVIIGGFNYGMGSSRPAARSLRNCGVGFLLAEALNGLFLQHAFSLRFFLPVMLAESCLN